MLEALTLTSRGKQMVCLVDYPDEASKGKRVILYKHGFMGNKITPHRMLVNLAHDLVAKGCTVVRFDCAGAGDSEGDCSYTTIPGEIQDTRVVLDYIKTTLRPERLLLLGYSMGGIVASLLAKEARPDGLILWSPVGDPYPAFEHLLGKERFAQGLAGQDVDFGGDRVGKEFFTGLGDPALNPVEAVKGFDRPVRIVHGDGDTDVPPHNSQAYAQAAPDVKRRIVPGATHGYDAVSHQDQLFAITREYIEEIWNG